MSKKQTELKKKMDRIVFQSREQIAWYFVWKARSYSVIKQPAAKSKGESGHLHRGPDASNSPMCLQEVSKKL